jgi:hypothetical protein
VDGQRRRAGRQEVVGGAVGVDADEVEPRGRRRVLVRPAAGQRADRAGHRVVAAAQKREHRYVRPRLPRLQHEHADFELLRAAEPVAGPLHGLGHRADEREFVALRQADGFGRGGAKQGECDESGGHRRLRRADRYDRPYSGTGRRRNANPLPGAAIADTVFVVGRLGASSCVLCTRAMLRRPSVPLRVRLGEGCSSTATDRCDNCRRAAWTNPAVRGSARRQLSHRSAVP